jgi:hypothetical protein
MIEAHQITAEFRNMLQQGMLRCFPGLVASDLGEVFCLILAFSGTLLMLGD